MTGQPLKVAIVGGGAAGLAATRVMSRNGLKPRVFEKDSKIGGIWRHSPGSKVRPMYQGLRTNLPREIMAYREKPWGSGPGKSFVTHYEVVQYLEEYKSQFNLDRFISYESLVMQLDILPGTASKLSTQDEVMPLIRINWKNGSDEHEETFDAVCVANGHYSKPFVPDLPGFEHYSGTAIHSIEYDEPSVFKNQTILCVGGRASGSDLAREISEYAEHVYLSDPAMEEACQTFGNVTMVPKTIGVDKNGNVQFDGVDLTPNVQSIIFCTGYDYSFPFINSQSNLDLSVIPGERRVYPLYEQLWHAKYPNLTFVGLPHSVLPFPLFELQVEAIVNQFQQFSLPPFRERNERAQMDAFFGGPKKSGMLKDAHYLGSLQWDYCRDMARLAGVYNQEMDNYITTNELIYDHASYEKGLSVPGGPDDYRSSSYKRDDENATFLVIHPTTAEAV